MIVTNPRASRSLTGALINTVSRGWWVLLVPGIISLVAGDSGVQISPARQRCRSETVAWILTLTLALGAGDDGDMAS
jgi:hypothetical protein